MTPRAFGLFVVVSVVWGIPYLLIAVALRDGLGPLTIVAGRVALGAALLLAVTARSVPELLRTHPGKVAVLALAEVVVPFALITIGEQSISSSLAGILIATEPAWVALFAALIGGHALPGARAWAGIGVGFAGVVVLLGAPGSGPGAPAVLAAAACYAVGAVLVSHWFAHVPSLTVASGVLVVATPITAVLAVAAELRSGLPSPTGSGVFALVALGVAGTAGGMAAFFALIKEAGPGNAALITYAAPIVALAAGVALLHEPLRPNNLIGCTLILAGAAVVMRAPITPDRRAAAG